MAIGIAETLETKNRVVVVMHKQHFNDLVYSFLCLLFVNKS